MKYSKIIIAGRRCTGKTRLFWNLQKALGWPMFSVSQYLRDVLRTYALTPDQLNEHSVEASNDIDQRVLHLLQSSDHAIIETRIIPPTYPQDEHTLRLLLVADEATRIKRSAGREGTSVEKAQKRLIQKEDKWIEKMERLYKVDNLFDSRYYNMILDTSQLTPSEVITAVLKELDVSTLTNARPVFGY